MYENQIEEVIPDMMDLLERAVVKITQPETDDQESMALFMFNFENQDK